ncbi:hypothetical protein SAMN05216490_4834 [Mucilaginibacter mallensis]|uniref:Outer membrane protein beta-barrel domain-containing protein n=1 Tax=Mucilaginibacter mallensis TaxID=652787 RepID=A0A1H2CBJ6_MUCMA|nr:hypothetical protein [Mucilaginibacter mallensis]SDT67811.1 hypothetical protein SAMN05216490_4834 [Mucilaginibacter mallensis]
MSDDQLDDDLKKRIKQVFDNYEDNTADEGWLLLREKYPEKGEKDRVIFWLWRIAGVAALLLMALGLGLWLNFHESGKQNIAQHNKKREITDTTTISKTAAIPNDKKQVIDSGANLAYQQQTTVAAHSYGVVKNTPSVQAGVNNSSLSANAGSTLFTAKVDSSVKKDVAYQRADKAKSPDTINSHITTAIADNKSPLKLISTRPATAPAEKEQPKVVANNPVNKGMQALFDKDAQNRATQNTEEQKPIDKKVAFAIYAATYVNYAKGSNKQFNTGVGGTADIRLTDNLRLSTGVSIGQNTLSYANNTTAVVPMALMAAASHNFTTASNMLYSVAPASTNLNANLVNLDIPVDLKYVFNPQKGNTYVSAGFSSGTFINETYNTIYNYTNGSSVQQTGDASHKSFDNFYFAQMLNVSFGVGYPVGKNQLIIEPFFKYPLNGMGDEHLLFGSGGLNLKFNFDPPKSKH